MMKWFKKRIVSPILKRFVKVYFKKERKFRYKSIRAVVLPGVFFPHFTFSTRFLLSFVETKDLEGASFLELGCGTGVISVLAAQKGADVLASDLNPQAIKNAERNATDNQVLIKTQLSDLFQSIPAQQFDYIVINPPYYPKEPANDAERAWFCGDDFDYFKRLFSTMSAYLIESSQVFMVLSEDCDLTSVQRIARSNGFTFVKVLEKKIRGEWNYIFQIIPD
jgi:release factor glutamine methyltransferase